MRKSIKTYHIINIDDKSFIFDTYNIVLLEINQIELYIFKNIHQNPEVLANKLGIDAGTVMEIIESFNVCFDKGLFVSEMADRYLETTSNMGSISITPTHSCNLRCAYCFASHGENYKDKDINFSVKNLNDALELVYFEIFKNAKQIRIEFVGGGEPLLNIDVIDNILKKVDELDSVTHKKTTLWLCTNGTIMSPQILKTIDNPKINIGISLDGNRVEHDKVRKNMYGEGTYNTIIHNLNYIKSNSKYRNLKDIWGLVVVTPLTKSLVDILEHHKALGFHSIQMKLVRSGYEGELSINKGSLDKIKQLYNELTDFLICKIEDVETDYLKMLLNGNDYFGKIIRRLILCKYTTIRCNAGKSKISINANGDVYPCDSFVGEYKYKLFNIYDDKHNLQNSAFFDLSINNRDKCQNCWAKYLCGGDCPYNSFLKSGTIYDPDKYFCRIQKHLIVLALKLFYKLSSNNAAFNDIEKFLMIRDNTYLPEFKEKNFDSKCSD